MKKSSRPADSNRIRGRSSKASRGAARRKDAAAQAIAARAEKPRRPGDVDGAARAELRALGIVENPVTFAIARNLVNLEQMVDRLAPLATDGRSAGAVGTVSKQVVAVREQLLRLREDFRDRGAAGVAGNGPVSGSPAPAAPPVKEAKGPTDKWGMPL